ncbi:MAG: hypothetical protein WBG44_14740, partial [Comamonas sp.]
GPDDALAAAQHGRPAKVCGPMPEGGARRTHRVGDLRRRQETEKVGMIRPSISHCIDTDNRPTHPFNQAIPPS